MITLTIVSHGSMGSSPWFCNAYGDAAVWASLLRWHVTTWLVRTKQVGSKATTAATRPTPLFVVLDASPHPTGATGDSDQGLLSSS